MNASAEAKVVEALSLTRASKFGSSFCLPESVPDAPALAFALETFALTPITPCKKSALAPASSADAPDAAPTPYFEILNASAEAKVIEALSLTRGPKCGFSFCLPESVLDAPALAFAAEAFALTPITPGKKPALAPASSADTPAAAPTPYFEILNASAEATVVEALALTRGPKCSFSCCSSESVPHASALAFAAEAFALTPITPFTKSALAPASAADAPAAAPTPNFKILNASAEAEVVKALALTRGPKYGFSLCSSESISARTCMADALFDENL